MEENGEFNASKGKEAQSFYSNTIELALKKRALTIATLLFSAMLIGALVVTRWLDVSTFAGSSFQKSFSSSTNRATETEKYELQCSTGNTTQTCPSNNQTLFQTNNLSAEKCPEYFRWIHEDLKLWKKTGISKEMVDQGYIKSNLRIVIVNGKLYYEKHGGIFQTRDVFTIWGILQLLRLYPGMLPDLDFLIQCGDEPVIFKKDYKGVNATPPLLFHYCFDDSTFDIPFPDWSFWGWPEINIKPWESLKKELEEGNTRTKWKKRKPFAYWKGNSHTGRKRGELVKCNANYKKDWGARIYELDWGQEVKKSFKETNLADQCTHRFKIYIEGNAWSVSEKYILACDSMTLLVKPQYYDFFTRGLQPLVHYWPISDNGICKSIKFAVDWGNSHPKKAQEIGRTGSRFIHEGLKMMNVYDYMFHLLNNYAKLLTYKPTIPPGATEVCSETMACTAKGLNRRFKLESMVHEPSDSSPCTMPLPYSPEELHAFIERKEKLSTRVKKWEESEDARKIKIGNFQ